LRLLEGGDHALSDFDTHLDAIVDFLNWLTLPAASPWDNRAHVRIV
jgi:hypothetical protein